MIQRQCPCCEAPSLQTYVRFGSLGSWCPVCGAEGPVTSWIGFGTTDSTKIRARWGDDGSMIGSIGELHQSISDVAADGTRVVLEFCACLRCGGAIDLRTLGDMVEETCRSCGSSEFYEVNRAHQNLRIARSYLVQIRCPVSNAPAMALLRKCSFKFPLGSLSEWQTVLRSEAGFVFGIHDNTSSQGFLRDLERLGCEIRKTEIVELETPTINWIRTL